MPGGAAVLAQRLEPSRTDVPLLRLVIRRYGKTVVRKLPPLDAAHDATTANATLAINWPFIQVVAESTTRGVAGVWTSRDGGRTWALLPGT